MNDTIAKPKPTLKTQRPKLHKVILVNDDYTPREFVVVVLGVLVAQWLAAIAQDRADYRRAAIDEAGLVEGVASARLAARMWRAAPSMR